MELQQRIRKILKDNQLNIGELADKTGVKKNSLYKMNNGTSSNMSFDSAFKINSVFPNYSVEWLTGEHQETAQTQLINEEEAAYKKTNLTIEDIITRKLIKEIYPLLKKLSKENETIIKMLAENTLDIDELKDLAEKTNNAIYSKK